MLHGRRRAPPPITHVDVGLGGSAAVVANRVRRVSPAPGGLWPQAMRWEGASRRRARPARLPYREMLPRRGGLTAARFPRAHRWGRRLHGLSWRAPRAVSARGRPGRPASPAGPTAPVCPRQERCIGGRTAGPTARRSKRWGQDAAYRCVGGRSANGRRPPPPCSPCPWRKPVARGTSPPWPTAMRPAGVRGGSGPGDGGRSHAGGRCVAYGGHAGARGLARGEGRDCRAS